MSKNNFSLNSPLTNSKYEPEPAKRLAVIDVGSNTVRLMVVEGHNAENYRYLHQAQEITRLGEGLTTGKPLQKNAQERTIKTILDFCQQARNLQAQTIWALGTSAMRRAVNANEFITKVKQTCGLEFDVVSGEDEARITLLGVETVIAPQNEKYLMIDIGGGSTEYILSNEKGGIDYSCSIELGAVSLTEQFLKQDPPVDNEFSPMVEHIREQISPVLQSFPPTSTLVGTAGTITTLAAITQNMTQYDAEKINNFILTKSQIKKLLKKFKSIPLSQRKKIAGLEAKRADIITAGTSILLISMEKLQAEQITVCDAGFREGIVLELFKKTDNLCM